MIRALVVDDSPGILMHHVRGLETHLDARVFAAENGKEAVAILKTSPVDVVVTDLSMPVMDGFALLAYLKRSYPNLPVIVATSLNLPKLGGDLFQQGALPILKKPVEAERLADEVKRLLNEVSQGTLTGISLPSFLQLLHWERKSCSLLVHSRGRKGRLHFLSGNMVDAFTFEEGQTGEEAARAILTWDEVNVEIERSHHNHKRLIHLPLEALLLDAARDKDEKRRASPATPKSDFETVAEAALGVLDKLLAPRQTVPEVPVALDMNDKTDTFQAALVTLLERACRAEEALAEVMQSVATLLEERQAEKRQRLEPHVSASPDVLDAAIPPLRTPPPQKS